MRRRSTTLLLIALLGLLVAGIAVPAAYTNSWLVRAGKSFQRAGEYSTVQGTRFQDTIDAYGPPSSCKVVGTNNHAIATWADRGIRIELWTYGGMPRDENGCISPDLIHVSEVRLTDPRWTTSLGLRVGDPTTKLRKLYPKAIYDYPSERRGRNQYFLVSFHGPCVFGVCSAIEDKYGVDYPRLTAQVKGGRVMAFWLPVFAQGE